MKWRTQTRPNGEENHRDVVPGLDYWITGLVKFAGFVAVIWAASVWCSDVTHNIADQKKTMDAIPQTIKSALAEHDVAAEAVTRAEWFNDKRDQDERARKIEEKIDHITEQIYRSNHLLEQLPAAHDPPR